MDEGHTTRLSELEPSARGRFVRISDSDPEMLRYLDERGVRLGTRWRSSSASRSAGR